jgi:hypothetical protein
LLASVTGLTLGASGNGGLAGNYNSIGTTGSSVTISKANVTLSGSRTYDGTTIVAGSVLSAAGVNGETFAMTGTGASGNLASKDVQAGSALASVSGLALGASGNGGLTGNYNATRHVRQFVHRQQGDLVVERHAHLRRHDRGGRQRAYRHRRRGRDLGVTGAGDASNLASKNVGTAPLASLTNLALGTSTNGGLAGNYNALGTAGSSVVITQKALDILGLTIPGSVTDTTAGPVNLNGTPALMTAVAPGTIAAGAPYTGTAHSRSPERRRQQYRQIGDSPCPARWADSR